MPGLRMPGSRRRAPRGRAAEGGDDAAERAAHALGNLARFILLPGQRHDCIAAPDLIDGIDMQALLADKGFDNNRLRELLTETQTKAVIPPKADRKDHIPCDFAMYRWRHLVENFFCNLKQFRGIATRYDKTDESFAAFIFIRAIHLELK